jgi:hypothetical protein
MVILPRWLAARYARKERLVEIAVLIKAIPVINLPVALVMVKNSFF